MRRIVICCFAFLIGLFCAVGCGRTGAGTERTVSAQDGQTDAEEEASRVEAGEPGGEEKESGRTEAGEAEPAREETAKAEDGEIKDGQTRIDGGKAGKEDAAGTEDGMTASDGNGKDGKAADGSQDGNADKVPGAAGNATSSQTGTKGTGGAGRKEAEGKGGLGAWGALSVSGTQLVDQDGNPVQLKGISTHGLAWYPEYVNEECFLQLKEEWGADIVRLAMYTAEYGGYCTGGSQDDLKALVKDGVKYATDCGLYAIIDWHILSDGNPNTYLEEAKKFFREMSEAYADYENVFYEICNEPNGGTSWSQIKAYAEEVIPVIREQDADGIILVGTPNWSQYVDQAAADPITGYENIMYTLHFYAATHKDSLRDTMGKAVDAGLPVFVSEYGICDASGNGGIDVEQANKWVEVMDAYGISYVAWNLSNKGETSAILKSSCTRTSGFTGEDLSDSGKWLLEMLGSPEDGKAGGQEGSPVGGSPNAGSETKQDSGSGIGTPQDNGNSAGNPQNSGGGTNNPQDNGTSTNTGTTEKDSAQISPGKPADSPAGQASPEAGDLTVKAEVINSWEQNKESYYQYEVTLTNPAETPREGWKITLTFESDIALQNGWNGNYQAEGNTLTITNMDYNGKLDAGGSVGNIGFIVKICR